MKKPIYKSWPFVQARNLLARYKEAPDVPVKFETGYGPSGLPHIGTFAEVARTTWVTNAFEYLTGWPTELIAFSDDMDGLRKVPPNVPQQEMLAENIGKPLCHIPDPYGKYESYSAHMNARLQEFLDRYDYDYRFQSSQKAYARGDFDEGLTKLHQNIIGLRSIVLPTLSEENQQNWSPFFPICEKCGKINSTRVLDHHPEHGTIDYVCDKEGEDLRSCGHKATTTILGGNVKAGWRTDWALRWYSYEIDYEMYGKDLLHSKDVSQPIIELMGKQAPEGFQTELFLDENYKKISKSKGNGLAMDTWLSYAPLESFLYFVYLEPTEARRMFWGMVPKTVDDYLAKLSGYWKRNPKKRPDSPIWHLYGKGGSVPEYSSKITFFLINNLISAIGTGDKELAVKYLMRYDPSIQKGDVVINHLVNKGMNYYRDHLLPNKEYRVPTEKEAEMLRCLTENLRNYDGDDVKEIQTIPFDVARTYDVEPKDFFKMFYEFTLGQENGPRFGTFVELIGKEKVVGMLNKVCGQ